MEKRRSSGKLLLYYLIIDEWDIVHTDEQILHADIPFGFCHSIIVHGKHQLVKLIIRSKHICLLHAGLTLF